MLAWHLKHEREMTWAEWFGIWHLWFLWAHSLDKRYGANMPGAEAEAKAAAMDNAVDVWRLNTASRLHWELTEGLDAHRMVTESQFHPTGQRKAWPNPQHTGENPVHVALQVHEPGVSLNHSSRKSTERIDRIEKHLCIREPRSIQNRRVSKCRCKIAIYYGR